jgi:hypothetical protein
MEQLQQQLSELQQVRVRVGARVGVRVRVRGAPSA